MANIADVSANTNLCMSFVYDPSTGQNSKVPAVIWPPTGGASHTRQRAGVYLPVLSPAGSSGAGGPTSGQLFPVGTT